MRTSNARRSCSERHNMLLTMISAFAMLFVLIFVVIAGLAGSVRSQTQQKGSSIVIHDSTDPRNGGNGATQTLRNEIGAALEREKPCVETMNDQDIRDAVKDERERELLEGSDSTATLQNLGNKLGSSMVMTVKAMPGPNGSVTYSALIVDTQTGRTVAREMGSDPKQLADKLVSSLGPYLADNCKPHWSGSIEYVYMFNESKTENDAGAMHATRKKVSRTMTTTSMMQSTIKATLLPPSGDNKYVNSAKARVSQRVKFIFEKNSSSSGEQLCREPGKKPYFKGFSEDYAERTTQLGQGTDTMPVTISVDTDGSYTIHVTAPGGVLLGKFESNGKTIGCGSEEPELAGDLKSLPDGRLEATSFEAEGKTDPRNRDVLTGSQTSPDGRTKISWKLRLVKPKGKG